MITAKKLVSETEDQTEQVQVNKKDDSRTQHVIKLLIIMLLTYVIIFM